MASLIAGRRNDFPMATTDVRSVDVMPSLLIAALPASIQSRIPKIRSLRRTGSMHRVFFRSESITTLSSVSTASSPALDSSVSSTSSTSSTSPASSSASSPTPSTCPSPLPSRPSTSTGVYGSTRSSGKEPCDLGLVVAAKPRSGSEEPSASRINWKYAQNGFRALQGALQEAGDTGRLPELERQIYIESLTYLLRGLPGDLRDGELSQLRDAAPDGLLVGPGAGVGMGVPGGFLLPPGTPLSVEQQQQLVLQQQGLGIYSPWLPGTGAGAGIGTVPPFGKANVRRRSVPHIVTHWLVTTICEIVLLLIPLFTSVARWVLEMERKYHLPEAALAFASTVFLMLYRNTAELYVAICGMGDGSVGRAFDDGAAYVANGVVSGFREAVLDVARGQK